jgi:hypothetical protein
MMIQIEISIISSSIHIHWTGTSQCNRQSCWWTSMQYEWVAA